MEKTYNSRYSFDCRYCKMHRRRM